MTLSLCAMLQSVHFDALDALRRVNATQDLVKVSYAAAWTESRSAILDKEMKVRNRYTCNCSKKKTKNKKLLC